MAEVTYENDKKWGTVRVIWDQRDIAGLEDDDDGRWLVTWGAGGSNIRSFDSRADAERFVEDNAGDIDDGVCI